MYSDTVQRDIQARFIRAEGKVIWVYPIMADGNIGQYEQRIGCFQTDEEMLGVLVEGQVYNMSITEKPAPGGRGKYRDLITFDPEPAEHISPPQRTPTPQPAVFTQSGQLASQDPTRVSIERQQALRYAREATRDIFDIGGSDGFIGTGVHFEVGYREVFARVYRDMVELLRDG